nr:alpha/beta hydrolase [uncultured Holophaga sp.]
MDTKPALLTYGDHPAQFLQIWPPQGPPTGAILVIHGGLWQARYDLGYMEALCVDLAARGLVAVNLEYRRLGHPGGGWPGTYQDVLAGLAAAQQACPGLPWRVLGHSAGGQLALRLAADCPDLEAVLALAPVSALRWEGQPPLCREAIADFLGGTRDSRWDTYEEADPLAHPCKVPTLLAHGTADHMVPVGMSRHFKERWRSGGGAVELLELPGVDHFRLVDPLSAAWQEIAGHVVATPQH